MPWHHVGRHRGQVRPEPVRSDVQARSRSDVRRCGEDGSGPCEVVCISDCARDEVAAKGAGIGCMTIGSFSTEDLIDRVGSNPAPEPDTRDYDSFRVPVMGIIGCIAGDTLGSRYEHHPTTDSDFPLFPSGSHPTDDSLGTLAAARWLLGDRTRVMFSTVTR